ncbi:MAG: hypothetical protein RLZZ511_1949 [Cyanobacteriota bacterium]|jgi:hypothetical protein
MWNKLWDLLRNLAPIAVDHSSPIAGIRALIEQLEFFKIG